MGGGEVQAKRAEFRRGLRKHKIARKRTTSSTRAENGFIEHLCQYNELRRKRFPDSCHVLEGVCKLIQLVSEPSVSRKVFPSHQLDGLV